MRNTEGLEYPGKEVNGEGYGCPDGDGFGYDVTGHLDGSGGSGNSVSDGCGLMDGSGVSESWVWDERGGGRSDDLGFWKNPEFSEEISNLLYPWTYENAPENILHAYAYINAATQEEKDSILGMLELRRH